MMDEVRVEGSRLHVRGWFFCHFFPVDGVRFLIDGKRLVEADNVWADPELDKLWSALPTASIWRFQLVTDVAVEDGPFHTIELLPSGAINDKGSEASSWAVFDPTSETDPLPPADNIYRVIGNRMVAPYQLGGATVATRLGAYVRRLTGKGIDQIGPILDWGCGCARVSRYLRTLGCEDLIGADVDATNVEWCRANVPWLDAQLIEFDPPMPFANEQFSLVFGISIFTHLRQEAQFAWLSELARVLKPGGLAIVTVMTKHQLALQKADAETIVKLDSVGFLVSEDNDQIHIGAGEVNDYVNTYHSEGYIHENWQSELELIEIVPFLGAHQDAVVLRKPLHAGSR
jgi:SAM-dependent methyltransferase